jgi:ketosteroid isomerase-like protein
MTHDEIEALADRLMAAIEHGDVATLTEIYAPDARIWHNFDGLDQSVPDNLQVLQYLHRTVRDLRYTEIRRIIVDDGWVQQHVLCGDAPGGPLAMPAMLRIHITDGWITRIEEYLDPQQAAVLRG